MSEKNITVYAADTTKQANYFAWTPAIVTAVVADDVNHNNSTFMAAEDIGATAQSTNYSVPVQATEIARHGYEKSVVDRAIERTGGGSKTGAHGNVFEILDTDQQNLRDIFNPNRHTQLTKDIHAQQIDAVTMENNVVVRRYQYKDTPNSIGKTIEQVKSGKYDQATLRGTTETAEKFNLKAEKAGLNKRMEDSGISTKTTNQMADKMLAVKNGTATADVVLSGMANAAKRSAAGAAGIAVAVEVGKSVINGDDPGTCARNVVSKGAESAVAGAVAGACGEGAFFAAAMVCPPVAVPLAAVCTVIGGMATGQIVDGVFDDLGFIAEDVVDEISYGMRDFGNKVEDVAYEISYGIRDLGDNIAGLFSYIFN